VTKRADAESGVHDHGVPFRIPNFLCVSWSLGWNPNGLAAFTTRTEGCTLSGHGFQQQNRSVGTLKLFRAPHRERGLYSIPPLPGISLRMIRSPRNGTATLDMGGGAFSASLHRHYVASPAHQACTCDISCEVDFLAIQFSSDAFEEHLGPGGDLGYLHSRPQHDDLPMQIAERLWQEETLTRLQADGLGLALVALLVRASQAVPRDVPRQTGIGIRRLARIKEYVDDHLAEDFSVSDLSDAAGGSATHVTTGFRATAGCSVWQFVLLRRVERAKSLLAGTSLEITEIAMTCGFSSSQHFATTFKKRVGATPTAYRRECVG
jgi:AraC family transcriptional regulator